MYRPLVEITVVVVKMEVQREAESKEVLALPPLQGVKDAAKDSPNTKCAGLHVIRREGRMSQSADDRSSNHTYIIRRSSVPVSILLSERSS